jgi:hypothetical protein
MIFNCGAPSHLDLVDPKPLASDTVRGPFAPIETAVPGLWFTELIPEVAQIANELAVVRTVHHTHGGHNSGMHWSIVGRPYKVDSTLINPAPSDHPSLGTLVGWLAQRDGYSGHVPPYVITPYPHCDSTVYITPGQYGGCLGVRYDPFVLDADPNAKDFRVRNLGLAEGLTPQRFQDRQSLQAGLSSHSRPIVSGLAASHDVFHSRAASMILSGDAARAFDLSQEPDSVRERYGRHSWGQSHLLARRLVEAGVRFIEVRSNGWDTHQDNFKTVTKLAGPVDRGMAGLITDLKQRGLLDSTLVVWMGEFGRTPKINPRTGRDHFPRAFNALLAGGGIRGGQVYGASSPDGQQVKDNPVTVQDLFATMCRSLQVDPGTENFSPIGRPLKIVDGGKPIEALFG